MGTIPEYCCSIKNLSTAWSPEISEGQPKLLAMSSCVWEKPVSLLQNCPFGKQYGIFMGSRTFACPKPRFLNLGTNVCLNDLKKEDVSFKSKA